MQALEFTIELSAEPVIAIPEEVAAQLPKAGQARVIILTSDDDEDVHWRRGAYEQFMRDDAPEDDIYTPADLRPEWRRGLKR